MIDSSLNLDRSLSFSILSSRRFEGVSFMRIAFASLALSALAAGTLLAAEPATEPRPIPLTRPEMKQFLEDMKQRTPRIPLPEMTAEEKERYGDDASRAYEGRLRTHYMPQGNERFSFSGGRNTQGPQSGTPGTTPRTEGVRPGGGFGGSQNEPGMTLDNRFKVSLFWIVSRTNNCQYCLGHQESKLLNAGMTEDEIAALDSDWSKFNEKEQAAWAFGRKFTLEPNKLSDADITELKKHFTDLQILEMILSMAGNNSINRWKEGVGVPQSSSGGGFGRRGGVEATAATTPREAHSYLTPTSDVFKTSVTKVAPFVGEASGKTAKTIFTRPALESRADAEAALAEARKRTPRLPLVDEAKAREILSEDAPEGPLPQWMRLLANFPQSGKRSVASTRFADEKGDLSPLVKAQAAWVIARQDRAWYALGQAYRRLKDLGQTDDQIFALDGSWDKLPAKDRSLLVVARNLAASPVVLTDAEVAEAVKLAGPRDVVQMVSYTTNRASFDRITEAAGLQVEP
jgi:alkylhydroperoxidase family enzyme